VHITGQFRTLLQTKLKAKRFSKYLYLEDNSSNSQIKSEILKVVSFYLLVITSCNQHLYIRDVSYLL